MTEPDPEIQEAPKAGHSAARRFSQELSSTSGRVLKAQDGDLEALSPIVEDMSPYLLALARKRLGSLRTVDPEDLVQEAWGIAIARLSDLTAPNGRLGAVLFRFLASTITRRINEHLRSAVRELSAGEAPGSRIKAIKVHPKTAQGTMLSRAIRSEAGSRVMKGLEALDGDERVLLLRRGVEGLPYGLIGRLLKQAPNTLAKRFQRLRARLRQELGSEVLEELMD